MLLELPQELLQTVASQVIAKAGLVQCTEFIATAAPTCTALYKAIINNNNHTDRLKEYARVVIALCKTTIDPELRAILYSVPLTAVPGVVANVFRLIAFRRRGLQEDTFVKLHHPSNEFCERRVRNEFVIQRRHWQSWSMFCCLQDSNANILLAFLGALDTPYTGRLFFVRFDRLRHYPYGTPNLYLTSTQDVSHPCVNDDDGYFGIGDNWSPAYTLVKTAQVVCAALSTDYVSSNTTKTSSYGACEIPCGVQDISEEELEFAITWRAKDPELVSLIKKIVGLQ